MAKRILVVEDNEDSRFILVVTLRGIGYETIEAETGTQGVEKALSEMPDLIVMDLGLPGMFGIDAARAVKENLATAHIPIIAHTAWSPSQWKEEALKVGMAEYLEKPVSRELMRATIEKFILIQEGESDKEVRTISEQNKDVRIF
jgi:CheY-like chemotaxis protein